VCRFKAPVSGRRHGRLIKEGERWRILTGHPRHRGYSRAHGLKVGGTERAFTALQMDMEMSGLAVETIAEAVNHGRPRGCTSSKKMLEAIERPREILSPHFCPAAAQLPHRSRAIGTCDRPRWRTIKGSPSAPTPSRHRGWRHRHDRQPRTAAREEASGIIEG